MALALRWRPVLLEPGFPAFRPPVLPDAERREGHAHQRQHDGDRRERAMRQDLAGGSGHGHAVHEPAPKSKETANDGWQAPDDDLGLVWRASELSVKLSVTLKLRGHASGGPAIREGSSDSGL